MPNLLKQVACFLQAFAQSGDLLAKSPRRSSHSLLPAQHLLALVAVLNGHIDRQHALICAVRIHDPNGPLAAAIAQKGDGSTVGAPDR